MDVRRLYLLKISLYLCCFLGVVSFKDITKLVFDSNVDGIIAAYGDFNSDKLTDIFFITDKGQSVSVFLAREKDPIFVKSRTLKCQLQNVVVTSVVPGDFNGDSKMDVLLTLRAVNQDVHTHPNLSYVILKGNITSLECDYEPSIEKNTMKGQPLVLDYNGDSIPDLYGETEDGTRQVWISNKNWTSTNITVPGSLYSIRPVHSNAFLNLQDDLQETMDNAMVADIFVTTTDNTYEVWHNQNGLYKEPEPGVFNISGAHVIIGQSAFLDIDLDGKLDHIVPVCFVDCYNSSIFVYFHGNWLPVGGPFVDWYIFHTDTYPATLRIGDFNLDGYPDLLTVMFRRNDSTKVAALLENVPCNGCQYHRRFKIAHKFNDIQNVTLAAFYDIYQDGNLDILIVSQTPSATYQITAIQNEVDTDVCFIKVLVLSGLCYPSCQELKGKPYGVNQPGPFISYKTTQLDGSPQKSCAAQLSQSAHFALQLPYTVFGLGQTPNFVDELYVGIPHSTNHEENNVHTWTFVIPNSQMIVIPLKREQQIKWFNNLFVTPSRQVLLTFLALVATCIVIIVIIGGLHWKEKIADKKERSIESHRFHFDAM